MAQKVLVQLVSDLTGEEIADGKGETVTFALDGTNYEIDLTNKEADKFRGVFQDYIAAGRKLGKSGGRKATGGTRAGSGSGRSKEELTDAREWLKQNGYDIPARGRIKQEYLDAYDAAMNAMKP